MGRTRKLDVSTLRFNKFASKKKLQNRKWRREKKIVLLYHWPRVTFTTRTVAQLADKEELRISDTFKPIGGGKEGEERMQKTRSK